MNTLGGGWTVIQRRGDFGNAPDFFLRNWTEYRNGFGRPDRELWIGLEAMFLLSNVEPVQVSITLWKYVLFMNIMCICILHEWYQVIDIKWNVFNAPLQMIINLEDFEGNRTAILVNEFRIANEESGYRIFYKNFSSPLGKSLPARGTKFR